MTASTTEVLWLTLQVASTATLLVMLPCTLLGFLLSRREFTGKRLVASVLTMPLVLPPTAVGYLLLTALAADGPLGAEAMGFDLSILLTWRAAVLAAVVMSTPLMVRTARVAFDGVDPRLEGMARSLGFGPVATFFRFSVPMAARGLLSALILGFTRAVGEFGATVTVAGNIPGETQTLASAIYAAQQVGDDGRAGGLILVALALGLVAVMASEVLSRPAAGHRRGQA